MLFRLTITNTFSLSFYIFSDIISDPTDIRVITKFSNAAKLFEILT